MTDGLGACMIDGFGWFREADYRRGWVSFDEVDYVFPADTVGPLCYLPKIMESPEYRAVRWNVPTSTMRAIVISALADMESAELMHILREDIPERDAHYAKLVVANDAQSRDVPELQEPLSPMFAVAVLANKLIAYALATNRVPIVGRTYASRYLATKLSNLEHPGAPENSVAAPPRHYRTVASVASGLSLAFIDDEQLSAVPFMRLFAFKDRHRSLLRDHQLYVVEAAIGFQGLTEGPDFQEKLSAVRIQAERKRIEIEREARAAWASAGLEIVKKALVAGTASVTTGFAVLRTNSLTELLVAAVPGLVAGVGVGLAESIDAAVKAKRARQHSLAYFMELADLGIER